MQDGDRPDAGMPADQQGFIRQLNALRTWAGNPSYSELARRCGIPRSTLADAFTDKRKSLPSLDLVIRLVRTLGCDRVEVEQWSAAWRWLAARRRPSTETATEDQDGPGEAFFMKLNPDGATEYFTIVPPRCADHWRDLHVWFNDSSQWDRGDGPESGHDRALPGNVRSAPA